MKKVFLILLISFLINIKSNADVIPYYINSIKRYGIGITKIKSPLVMRQEPSKEGKILETLNFDFKKNEASCLINKNRCETDEVFSVFSSEKQLAFLSTIDNMQDWNLVCFNQIQTPVCGWVETKDNTYYTWTEFINEYGKKYGLRFFKDVVKNDKILYSAPIAQTNSTGSVEMPKYISPWLVRGNWVLVKIHDFDNNFKTGYLKYRDEYGKLKMFVNF